MSRDLGFSRQRELCPKCGSSEVRPLPPEFRHDGYCLNCDFLFGKRGNVPVTEQLEKLIGLGRVSKI